jgi:hypothetical protein
MLLQIMTLYRAKTFMSYSIIPLLSLHLTRIWIHICKISHTQCHRMIVVKHYFLYDMILSFI